VNGIGIDFGATVCRVQVGETVAGRCVHHAMSDGVRRCIPRLAGSGGSWASGAADDATLLEGPDADLAFWRGLQKRLRNHLGGLRPDPRDGWRVTVAYEGEPDTTTLRRNLTAVGFERCTLISPTDALIAAYATSPDAAQFAGRVVVSVSIGELQGEVRAVRLGARARLGVQSARAVLAGLGHGVWRDHLRQVLYERLPQEPGLSRRLAIDDSIAAYAREFAQGAVDQDRAWFGAGSDQLFSAVTARRGDMRQWPQVRVLEARMSLAVAAAARELGEAEPALIVLGGLGAGWPFVRAALPDRVPVWRSPGDEDLVAIGAAMWPLLDSNGPASPTLIADGRAMPLVGSAPTRTEIAPWQRPDPFAVDEGEEDA
jgi:hypothetical protein